MNVHQIALEGCPSSNVETGAVNDLVNQPLKLFFGLGLRWGIPRDQAIREESGS